MNKTSNLLAGAAALGLTLLAAWPAKAGPCWSPEAVKAAKVRDFQTLLMVGALQCRGTSDNLLGSYNRFVRVHRGVIGAHNDVLKAHFNQSLGARAGQSAYDRFTTALANDHAANASGGDFCRQVAGYAADAAAANASGVEAMADELIDTPRGVGSACGKTRLAAR